MAKDIISTLPDEILCHILSFLRTKEADATTILSKRWKHLWRSVTTLRIDNDAEVENLDSHYAFIHFVDSVLFSRHPAFHCPLKLSTFKLCIIILMSPPLKSLTNWVNFVVQGGVECLDLDMSLEDKIKLPITVLTCKTLVVLKLDYFNVDLGHSSVLLPSLKTCHLDFVRFSKFRDFTMFLKGCPILQYLYTYHVSFDHEEDFTCNEWKSLLSTNLIRADIDCNSYYFPVKAVHNVQSLRFGYRQEYYRNDLIPTFHNLTQLELSCHDYSKELLLDVLNHCPNLQRLDLIEIGANDKEVCTKRDDKTNWAFPDVVPQCLSLYLRTCNLLGFRGLHGDLMLASYILKNASVLQTMKIWSGKGKSAIKRILSAVPTASSMCKLMVYDDS
ncbi:hypothetical protein TSUD_173570 [Trifolium subterraneum]|nr:hypothetical protein TSUD_173570 [Trifolium subterraneum]